jgi:hypothetical protein
VPALCLAGVARSISVPGQHFELDRGAGDRRVNTDAVVAGAGRVTGKTNKPLFSTLYIASWPCLRYVNRKPGKTGEIPREGSGACRSSADTVRIEFVYASKRSGLAIA